jgi:hypothetical protein
LTGGARGNSDNSESRNCEPYKSGFTPYFLVDGRGHSRSDKKLDRSCGGLRRSLLIRLSRIRSNTSSIVRFPLPSSLTDGTSSIDIVRSPLSSSLTPPREVGSAEEENKSTTLFTMVNVGLLNYYDSLLRYRNLTVVRWCGCDFLGRGSHSSSEPCRTFQRTFPNTPIPDEIFM